MHAKASHENLATQPLVADKTNRHNPRGFSRCCNLAAMLLPVLLAACSGKQPEQAGRYTQRFDSAPDKHVDLSNVPDAIPRIEPKSRYGNPDSYEVLGKRYYPKDSSKGYSARGITSWYGTKFHGHRTSSGEPYDMYKMTAAHKTLPLPTYARVTNLENGKTVVVKVNDRGPFHENRIMDLSYAAASRLDILDKGTGLVEIKAIDPAESANIVVSRPKAEPTNESPSKESSTPKPSLYLQVGAFVSRDNAERLKSRLQSSVPAENTQIFEAEANSKHVYRVRIGPLASVESADKLASALSEKGLGTPQVVID